MSKLTWGAAGEKVFQTGIDRGVLYVNSGVGVPWNGLLGVTESPTGGDPQPSYIDGFKYYNSSSLEEYEATLNAFMYPEEFEVCDGTVYADSIGYTAQDRAWFNLAYRAKMGNDLEGLNYGYKIHLIYQAQASPSQNINQTTTNTTNLATFSWKLTARPVEVPNMNPTSHLILDSTRLSEGTLATIEDYLYGTDLVEPRMLFPADLIELMPWVFFELVPNPDTGLAQLVLSDTKRDLRSTNTDGVFKRTPVSRLKESSTPGFFSLDVD
ncbi:major tail protein [Arthrobacter phage Cheesy]|uniref:Major tail protein n=1 Tax=Arthrobacter phage Cheesy TaxID=2015816 RepID=A0A222ZIP7_9CAUD|nr:major tail protein [Arthrobacter phage Cheesy]ASR84597.1 major tail protein [Arthrobacter phage Cheesy]